VQPVLEGPGGGRPPEHLLAGVAFPRFALRRAASWAIRRRSFAFTTGTHARHTASLKHRERADQRGGAHPGRRVMQRWITVALVAKIFGFLCMVGAVVEALLAGIPHRDRGQGVTQQRLGL